jgi:hypothetical protein
LWIVEPSAAAAPMLLAASAALQAASLACKREVAEVSVQGFAGCVCCQTVCGACTQRERASPASTRCAYAMPSR